MFTLFGWLLGYILEEGVIEWYDSIVQPLDWIDGVLVMLSFWLHMRFSYLWCMCLLHLCCVDHGDSGVSKGGIMVFLTTYVYEYMIDYVLFMLLHCVCTLCYMLLHVVYALLVYARLHIGHLVMLV